MAEFMRLELMLALMALAGFFLQKHGIFTSEGKKCLMDLIMDVLLPCNIFLSFLGSGGIEILKYSLITVVLGMVVIVGSSAIAWFLYRKMAREKRAVFLYGIANSNAIFIGLPIIESLLGADGVLQHAMYMIFDRVYIWTYALSLYTGTQGSRLDAAKRLIKQPALIAAMLGIAAMLADLKLPAFLQDTMQYFSRCVTPMSMLLVGTVLTGLKGKDILRWDVWGFCGLRLLLLPGLALVLCGLLGTPYVVSPTYVLITGMPAASMTAVLAIRYQVDERTAASVVALSTVMSAVTIPMWFTVLQWLW